MKLFPYLLTALLMPFVSYGVAQPTDFKGLVDIFLGIMQLLVFVIFAITFITIMWKVIQGWVIHGGEPDGIEAGKQTVIAGIIALVVMMSLWGIIYMLRAGFFGS